MRDDLTHIKNTIVATLRRGQWAEALPLLESWCESFPEHAKSWLNRGYCLVKLGRYGEAIGSFDRCLELDPRMEQAAAWRRRALAALDRAHTVADDGSTDASTDGTPAVTAAAAAGGATQRAAAESQAPPSFATMAIPGAQRGWQPGTIVEGRYEVRKTARGGMALVAIAFDRELRRMVAVKTPLPSVLASTDGRARFQREAESWIALGVHPNICCAHYLQEIGGMPRLFIEYVDGGDLSGWLKSGKLPELEDRLDAAIQIASGLDYTHTFEWTDDEDAHHRGLVHRDIKPANVLMTNDGVARVTDFGLVRAHVAEEPGTQDVRQQIEPPLPAAGSAQDSFASGSWQTVTAAGGLVGTPPYMAPELWRASQKGTIASDVYAYGCMLYELFCGRRPFVLSGSSQSRSQEEHIGGFMRMHLRDRPPDPRDLTEGLNDELADLMVACLDKDPGARPKSFEQLRTALLAVFAATAGRPYPRPEPQRTQLLADSLNNRGASFVTLGLEERASSSFREALSIDPRHLEATFNGGLLEWRRQGLTDAELERRLDEAARAAPGAPAVALLRAQLSLLLDKPKDALESLDRLPEDGVPLIARQLRGLALLAAARSDGSQMQAEKAARVLQEVVLESRSDTAALVALAEACDIAGEGELRDQALAAAKSLDREVPSDARRAASAQLPGHWTVQVLEHRAAVQCLRELPSGARVARVDGGEIVVWARDGARAMHRLVLDGPARPGRSIALAGELLVACCENAPITVYDPLGRQRIRSFRTHPGVATCVEVSPDCNRVASGGSDRAVRLWSLATGECEVTWTGHEAFVSGVAWHPLHPAVVTVGADGSLRSWRLDGSDCRVLEAGGPSLRAIALGREGRVAVAGGNDGVVGLWDLDAGRHLRWLRGHGSTVTCVAMLADVVVAGAEDGTVRLWHADSGQMLRVMRLPTPIHDLIVSSEDTLLVGHGSSISELLLPEPTAARLPLVLAESAASGELAGREAQFRAQLAVARECVAAGEMTEALGALRAARAVPGYDLHREALDLWSKVLAFYPKAEPRTVVELQRLGGSREPVTACALMRDGRSCFSVDRAGVVRRLDCDGDGEVFAVAAHPNGGTAIAVSSDGSLVASTGRDGSLRVLRTSDGSEHVSFEGPHGALRAVVFASGDGGVWTAGDDGVVRLWRLDQSARAEDLGGSDEAVVALAVSDDGRYVVSGGWDSLITVWSLEARSELRRLEGHEGPVLAVSVSPDCRVIASAGADGSVRLWDLERGRCVRELTGHEGAVQSVAFTPDGRWLLSAADDSTIRLWNLRSAAVSRVIHGHAGAVADLSISRDGGRAVSAGSDSGVRVWFLDWEPEVPEGIDWDDRVLPFLEVFLRRREASSLPGSTPVWADHDLEELLEGLRLRGFGWLPRRRVEANLERLARQRGERRTEEHELSQQLARRRRRQVTSQPLHEVVAALGRNLGARTAMIAAGVVIVIALLWSLTTPGGGRVGFSRLYREIGVVAQARAMRLEKGTVHAFHASPSLGSVNCGEEAFADLVDLALNPERFGPPGLDPGRAASRGFQQRYANAVNCVGKLGDSSLVDPVLRRARRGLHPTRVEDLAGVLVRVGGARSPAVVEALGDASESARHLAALTLCYGDGGSGVPALVEALDGDDEQAVEAASSVLLELICRGALSEDEAFDQLRRLSHHIDPAVRRNAVRAIVVFEEKEPMVEVLEAALGDSDPEVAAAAEKARQTLDRAG